MAQYEYKVVPAPMKGQRAKGAKGAPGRFALALETLMNDLAAEGWEYLRADTLPSEERSGLTGSTTVFQNMLVFRRDAAAATAMPRLREVTQDEATRVPDRPAPPAALPAGPEHAPPEVPAPVATLGPEDRYDAGGDPADPEARREATEAAAAAAAAFSAYRGVHPPAKGAALGPARRRGDDDEDAAAG